MGVTDDNGLNLDKHGGYSVLHGRDVVCTHIKHATSVLKVLLSQHRGSVGVCPKPVT